LDRRLRIDSSQQSEWIWAVPVAVFAITVAILVFAGAKCGAWPGEYISTALVVGLVISGLFVAGMLPEDVPAENGQGHRGPDPEPSSSPPPFDPTIWLSPAAPWAVDAGDAHGERRTEPLREPVGAAR